MSGGPASGWYRDPAGGDQLRWWDGQRWTEAVREAAPPADAGAALPLEDAEAEDAAGTPGGRRRGVVVAGVLGVVVVLVGAGVGVWVAGLSTPGDEAAGGSPEDAETSGLAGKDSAESAGGAIEPDAGHRWSRIDPDEAVFGGSSMYGVVEGGPGLVAVGQVGSNKESTAAVWTSADGLSWSRVAHDEAVFGGPGGPQMFAVVAGGPGLVAVGRDGGFDEGSAAVWASPDGLDWSRVAHDEAVFGGSGGQQITSVVQGGPGLVAVGQDGEFHEGSAAVWTSADGLSWSRVAHDEAVFGGPEGQWMFAVAHGGPGLVAVGRDGDGDGSAAVWTSADGSSWSRVAHDETVLGGVGGPSMSSVVQGGPGLVAVGTSSAFDEGSAAVWTSPDGFDWSRVPHDEAVFGGPGDQRMYSVTAGGPGLVAVGRDSGLHDGGVAVWTSSDGVSWSRVPHDDEAFGGGSRMRAVVKADVKLIGIGGGDAPVWLGE